MTLRTWSRRAHAESQGADGGTTVEARVIVGDDDVDHWDQGDGAQTRRDGLSHPVLVRGRTT